ncbi:CPSF A subunit region-domain-containing protein [Syncephalastrum racemosum]|uniref:CPSF A subunit region-domain-containing protein n=1 Tax=Syncephalastrum racemosum TaxID=13706 RepID=A0A1X2HCU4_SYNRA|nr:CPSF A subunit region-domain-containing protein [Syncephalastrum racemosum]
MSAYTIYKELFPPQTVEHVECGHFTSPDVTNLIVAKASLLQIYAFVEYSPPQKEASSVTLEATDPPDTSLIDGNSTSPRQTTVYDNLPYFGHSLLDNGSGRLELVAQYQLNGTVATMGMIRTSTARGKDGCDSLLLGFNDAKMSLLEWSPSTNSIITVSIHYYERDEYKKEFLTNPYPPSIHIDPQQRCAILNFYGDKLAVLPFHQSDKLDSAQKQDEEKDAQRPYGTSFVIDLEAIDKRVKNVIDVTFLSDYYEPTLAILFQTDQTWTGRLAHAKDTVSIVVISLDLSSKIYPVIYSLDNLPYDCLSLVAMPKPVNGLLVLASNSLLHVSQGSPGVGVAVNGYTQKSTDFQGMMYDDNNINLNMSLDGAKAMVLDGGRCLVFLQSGDWLLVQMKLDGSKVVGMELAPIKWSDTDVQELIKKNIREFPPLAEMPSCVTSIKNTEYFFLGSRVGDSLLVKWRFNAPSSSKNAVTSSCSFRVCDTLINTGPIVDMAIGQAESSANLKALPELELVSCSGYGKNGAVCVFQRHVRPISAFSFDQSDCKAVWSVKCRTEKDGNDTMDDVLDKLLFISKSKSTLVLAAGEELQELETSDFYTAGPTVKVDTVCDNTRIVQVHTSGVLILSANGKLLQTVNVKQSSIVDASIQDPFVLLKLKNGSIMLLSADPITKQVAAVPIPSSLGGKEIAQANIFADSSGLFLGVSEKRTLWTKKREARRANDRKRKPDGDLHTPAATKKPFTKSSSAAMDIDFDELDMDLYGDQSAQAEPAPAIAHNASNAVQYDMDDDDEMLYGDSKPAQKAPEAPATLSEEQASPETVGLQEEPLPKTFWCLLYTSDGVLRIYRLPDFQECFTMEHFNDLSSLLEDDPEAQARLASGASTSTYISGIPGGRVDPVQEVLLTDIGKERKDPHLVVRTHTNDIVIYKAFHYLPGVSESDNVSMENGNHDDTNHRLALRFSRVHHDYVSHTSEVIENDDLTRQNLLIPFHDVAGYTGVFVAGAQPAWIMCSCKSFVRLHPMKTNQRRIVGFSQFHNVNCQHGFITIDSESSVRLCHLPTNGVTYDMDWVMQKVPVGQTIHKIEYHPTMRVYAALVSSPRPVRLRNEEGQPIDNMEDDGRAEGTFLPTVEQFSMIMISPVTWETVDKVDFQEYEQGLSLFAAQLESKQTSTGRKYFMAVGTGFLKGEDSAMRGSIHIFDIIEVVPEPDNPQTNHKFKQLHTEDVKGAVTTMCDASGHLVSCIGSKVIIWSFEDNESLVGVAFIDVQIYVTSIRSIKNFIVLGDAQKSVWFLGFQLEPAKLVLLGKDYQAFEVSCVDFIIDDKSMYLLVGDTDDNLDIFQYAPFNLQSFAGQKLMRRGDFHVGTQVQSMVRLPQLTRKEEGFEYNRRHFCICGTFGGSISAVSPVPEKTFKRLNTLFGQIVNGLQHVAGLNPRAYRLIKGPKQRMSSNRTKAVLDGDLVFQFAGLSVSQQNEMTKQIGTTASKIREDLVDIDSSIDHF